MTSTIEDRRRTQKIRDRIQWTLADGANTLRGVHATLRGTGLDVSERAVLYQLNNLWHKGLVHRNLGMDHRYYYSLIQLKDKTNAKQR